MKVGDLVSIYDLTDQASIGLGVYLGIGSRGTERLNDNTLFEFLWRGRICTFDKPYWDFRVIT